jgi:hypothetical protein
MIIRNHASSSVHLFMNADNPLTADCPRSTAHLIEPLTFFPLVRGEKADNHIVNYSPSSLKAYSTLNLLSTVDHRL